MTRANAPEMRLDGARSDSIAGLMSSSSSSSTITAMTTSPASSGLSTGRPWSGRRGRFRTSRYDASPLPDSTSMQSMRRGIGPSRKAFRTTDRRSSNTGAQRELGYAHQFSSPATSRGLPWVTNAWSDLHGWAICSGSWTGRTFPSTPRIVSG
jgi:hypothetical protein